MPNIVLAGFRNSSDIREKIETVIIKNLFFDRKDVVVTELTCSEVKDFNDKESPYIIVRDTLSDRAEKIGKALNDFLNVDVEIEEIKFFPKK